MRSDVVVTEHGREAHAARVESIWQQIGEHLHQERRRVASEITTYPTPIAGCDAQFTALLDQREQLAQELDWCDAYRSRGLADDEARAHVEEFLALSACVPDQLLRELRSALAEAIDHSTTQCR